MVPPCFAAPLQARPCALASASICAVTGAPGAGLAHGASPAQLRGHLPLRACLPGSIVRAFCQALSGRTLLIQAVCCLPKGILAPCSYYNTQKRWICQPGNWFVLSVSVLTLSVTCGDSSGLRATGSPSQSKPDGFASSPKGGAIGRPGKPYCSLGPNFAQSAGPCCLDSRLLNLALSVTCGDSSPKGRANCGSRLAAAKSGICVASPFGRGGNAPALTERAYCGSRPAASESRRCVGSPFGGAGIKRSADD